ncbi:flavin reductase family protein [Williamsia sterculiae]|uniref:NADH-FMN oxidoreductase RutF, flavin reductase (DIM6/NTAB) family n=1 Tax=Williamsia sterculiae TaxID=1344003 RepID=A0A1N7FUK0_9NOCA|nr:flavin reductase family protein [Williamsia sterculiae]SIS04038.1 NADH-FMN oxidoreductase RutF, flavin reductase (DIM6/NTAB) family [Williamsia sterculiae]
MSYDDAADRDFHFFEPAGDSGLPHSPFNAIIAPRPIGWISSRSADGVLNLAPYSFFNAFNYIPPIIGFASNGDKDSLGNSGATGDFCWNLVTRELAGAMNATSATVPADVDEFALAGLTPAESTIIDAPHVAQARVVFECRTSQIVPLRSASGDPTVTTMVFGEVVGVHIDRTLLVDGVYQTALADPVLRAGGASSYYTISDEGHFDMTRPQ